MPFKNDYRPPPGYPPRSRQWLLSVREALRVTPGRGADEGFIVGIGYRQTGRKISRNSRIWRKKLPESLVRFGPSISTSDLAKLNLDIDLTSE